jgi:hypothetical protein
MSDAPRSPIHEQLLQKLSLLEAALLAGDPEMPRHLSESHKLVIQHEELVHLLNDEEIGVLMAAQQKHSGVVLASEVKPVTESKAKIAKVKSMSMGDI